MHGVRGARAGCFRARAQAAVREPCWVPGRELQDQRRDATLDARRRIQAHQPLHPFAKDVVHQVAVLGNARSEAASVKHLRVVVLSMREAPQLALDRLDVDCAVGCEVGADEKAQVPRCVRHHRRRSVWVQAADARWRDREVQLVAQHELRPLVPPLAEFEVQPVVLQVAQHEERHGVAVTHAHELQRSALRNLIQVRDHHQVLLLCMLVQRL
mmetsp:Transcript_62568/g.147140  ORF Transcript_62568/g.147140 Transcript_62568/m.147140 type:complete len:213 (+) Transcript_62568:556-1194(+)